MTHPLPSAGRFCPAFVGVDVAAGAPDTRTLCSRRSAAMPNTGPESPALKNRRPFSTAFVPSSAMLSCVCAVLRHPPLRQCVPFWCQPGRSIEQCFMIGIRHAAHEQNHPDKIHSTLLHCQIACPHILLLAASNSVPIIAKRYTVALSGCAAHQPTAQMAPPLPRRCQLARCRPCWARPDVRCARQTRAAAPPRRRTARSARRLHLGRPAGKRHCFAAEYQD